ncbi:MAG TPA: ATP-binding protein [Candidatus Dormibacteraeota bacterium]|nr:ATP-binding protein [Candidatus Dormibacteraeota bacterium]
MKLDTGQKSKPGTEFEAEYAASLREYAMGGGESVLGRAYELGRRAIRERKSLLELVALHHRTLQDLFHDSADRGSQGHLVQTSCDFLSECVSPYEMAQRGFQDAVKALRQLNETLEEEIKRIAYSVHDEAGQLLVAVHLALANLGEELPQGQRAQLNQITDLLNEVEKHLRRYSHELRPTILDDLGWIPAIKFLAEGVSKRANLPIHIETKISKRPPGTFETTLYRIVQEALTNAVKHANAKNVWIRAWIKDRVLHCSIRDDGSGFDAQAVQASTGKKGLGLIAMRERLSAIGGTLWIESSQKLGTEILIRLPMEDDNVNSSSAS